MKPGKRKAARSVGFCNRSAFAAGAGKRVMDSDPLATGFSVLPLLVADENISVEAREALLENRLDDAAEVLMQQYGLNCMEAGDLVGVSVC